MRRAKHNRPWKYKGMVTLSSKDIVRAIAHSATLDPATAKLVLKIIVKYLIKRIRSDEKVYIDRFGEFHKRLHKESHHIGKGPATRYTIYFRCSETLAKLLRKKWHEDND